MVEMCHAYMRTLFREYFGCKLGFYFAWLGFYTSALGYVAILGVFCALYGLTTVWTDQNT